MDRRIDSPRFDVDALLHESAEREPETVEDGEVVGNSDAVRAVLDVPLERTKPTDEEQDDADADVCKHDTHPYLPRHSLTDYQQTLNAI